LVKEKARIKSEANGTIHFFLEKDPNIPKLFFDIRIARCKLSSDRTIGRNKRGKSGRTKSDSEMIVRILSFFAIATRFPQRFAVTLKF